MATTPDFLQGGVIGCSAAPITAANATTNGTGLTTTEKVHIVSTAEQEIVSVKLTTTGTNVASAVRVWIVLSDDPSVVDNNILWEQQPLPATTASNVAGIASVTVPIGLRLPVGTGIYASLLTTVASGYRATAIGKQY